MDDQTLQHCIDACRSCVSDAPAIVYPIPKVNRAIDYAAVISNEKILMGDTIKGGSDDHSTPDLTDKITRTIPAMGWGMNLHWNLLSCTTIAVEDDLPGPFWSHRHGGQ